MSTDMLGRCLTCGMHIDSTSALCLNCHTYAPNPMVSTVIVGGPMPSGVTITQQPAPVSATEPDAVRMLREGMRGQHALFNVNQEYVCAVAPLLEYIDALTARLAEAERVTEEQVERACVAVAAANQTPWPTGDVAFDQRIRRRMHTALTAARRGWVMEDDAERAALIAELDATGCTMNICGTNGRPLPLASLRELVEFAKKLAATNAARAATTGEG